MEREFTFAKVLENAPPIRVFRLDPFESAETTMLKPQKQDRNYSQRPYSSDGFITGDGTLDDPHDYRSAAPVSVHYAIIDMWFKFRHSGPSVFIKVNDWLLRVDRDGVTAEDGHFTTLIPEQKKKGRTRHG